MVENIKNALKHSRKKKKIHIKVFSVFSKSAIKGNFIEYV